MDPNATLAIMRDIGLNPTERAEAATDLLNWIGSGGYLPSTGYGFGGNTATKFCLQGECRKVIEEANS